jgi:alpha-L-rhamnosidase
MNKNSLNFVAFGIGFLLSGTLCGSALADTDESATRDFRETLLRPEKVVSVSGDVQNAEALVEDHEGYTTLTMVAGGTAPLVVLDYGRDVGGIPVFEVSSVSGTPKLQAFYSESQQYLLPAGDGNSAAGVSFVGDFGAGDLARADTYPVNGPGLVVNRLIQGGERFQAITLTAPGSVTLRRLGIRPTFFIPPHSSNRGRFICSDPALDEIWGLGAYALLLDQVPVRSLPTTWTPTREGVVIPGKQYCVYQAGANWTDYRAATDVQVLTNEAALMVRGTPTNGIRVTLAADNDALGQPNAIRIYLQSDNTLLGKADLPFDLKPGSWHHIEAVAAGNQVSASLDGQSFLSVNIAGLGGFAPVASGSVGFANEQGAEGQFRNLLVTASGGKVLYSSPLTDPSVLNDFTANTNQLPTIIDGAKRDRYVWSGDIAVSGPTVYYSNGASEYVRGSLQLDGSYQLSNGRLFGALPPQLLPGVTSADNTFQAGIYAWGLPYSIYFVTNLYEYYLYAGDLDFVRREWSVVQKELAYLRTNTNAQHLIVTTGLDGLNWHLDFPPPGTVTQVDIHYYAALSEAARLADALGQANVAAEYDAEAGLVKDAINATLFDATTGLYDISDSLRGPAAQDANAFAVLFGVAPGSKWNSILGNLKAALNTANGPLAFAPASGFTVIISPFSSSFEAWARFEAGDATGALSLIRTVWGQMRKGQPFYSGATWERMTPDAVPDSIATSLAHGWGSGPTSALSKYVLGVRPTTAGYKTWLIEPQPGDLTWAEGTVLTPRGPIKVRWEKEGNGFELLVEVPDGTSGTVGVPISGVAGRLIVNGQSVKSEASFSEKREGRPSYAYVRDLAPGTYRIVVPAVSK